MDLDSFKNLLSGFSKVSKLHFEVHDSKGRCFYIDDERRYNHGEKYIRSLSSRVIEEEKYLHMKSENSLSLFGMPIKNGTGSVASLIAYNSSPDTPDTGDMERFLSSLAALFEDNWSYRKEAKKMAQEIDQSYEELYLYSKIASQIKTLRFTETMQKELIEDLLGIMRVDMAFTDLKQHEEYNVLAFRPDITKKVSDPDGLVKRLLKIVPGREMSMENQYFIINDSRESPQCRDIHTEPFRFLAVKIRNNMDLHGWLGLLSFNLKEIFRTSELNLLVTMAEQIAVVLSNQDLYRDLERFVINVVKSLVHAIEAKDWYTRGHSERVNSYCMMIADKMNIDEEGKKALHWASILHDIGKIAIPESILNKPARLSDEEYNIIKKHPEKGYEILQPIEQLRDSLPGILCHHERFDGKGYPEGLEGENIPFSGRVIAVADTFDAITSDRAYRAAKKQEEAMVIINEVAGSQLDPVIVKVFNDIFKEGLTSV